MSKNEDELAKACERLTRLADALDALVDRRTRRMNVIDAARDLEAEGFEAAAKRYHRRDSR